MSLIALCLAPIAVSNFEAVWRSTSSSLATAKTAPRWVLALIAILKASLPNARGKFCSFVGVTGERSFALSVDYCGMKLAVIRFKYLFPI